MYNDFRSKMKFLFPIITGIFTVIPLMMILYTQLRENRVRLDDTTERYRKEITELEQELRHRTEMLYRIERIKMSADSTQNIDDAQKRNEIRFVRIEGNIEKQTEIITALRQAINPLKPDEVLTIARLQDGIIDLNKNVTELENNINVRLQYFEDSIKREMTSSNNSTTLILVVLIPLVLNFLYTVWKDFRKPEKNETQQMPNA